jgi:hypothetical protein
MSGAGLSPKTIDNYAGLVKMVVASAVDAEGGEIFPRKWNHEFIDMPVVEKSKQNTPCFSGDVMTGLAGWKKPRERALFILCGAAGLRIGGSAWYRNRQAHRFRFLASQNSPESAALQDRRAVENLECASGRRPSSGNSKPAEGIRRRTQVRVPVLDQRNGKPIASSNVIRRHLHPALKELNYVNLHTGDHKAGNHAFRRFRNTYLRNHTECPKGLYKYWMGHAGESMSDLYDKIKEDVSFNKK